MGRRKKDSLGDWRGVEWYLRRETATRQAVRDERKELSFIRATSTDGRQGTKRPDRTSALAIKLAEELRAVVLPNGDTIKRPESWLSCFDAVRGQARQFDRAEWILEEWDHRYRDGGRYIGELMGGQLKRGMQPDTIILWIIQQTEEAATARGLLSLDDCLVYEHEISFLDTCKPRRID